MFCLKNAKTIKKDGFDKINFNSIINLPNKCHNNYISYENNSNNKLIDNINVNKTLLKYVASKLSHPNEDYLKFEIGRLNQLPGYSFLIITLIKSSNSGIEFDIYIIFLGIVFILVLTSLLKNLNKNMNYLFINQNVIQIMKMENRKIKTMKMKKK